MDTILVFKELINEYLDRNRIIIAQNTLLIMQGFPIEFYNSLNELNIKHITASWNEKYIDYNSIDGKALLAEILKQDGMRWCFYEEFINLSGIINDFSIFGSEFVVVKNNLFKDSYPIPVDVEANYVLKIFDNESAIEKESKLRTFYSDCVLIDDILFFSYINRHYVIDTGIEVKESNFYEFNQPADISTVDITSATTYDINLSNLTVFKYKLQLGLLSPATYNIKARPDTIESEMINITNLGKRYGIKVETSFDNGIDSEKTMQIYQGILEKYWGKDAEFRERPFYKNPALSSETIEVSQGAIISDIVTQVENAQLTGQYSDVIVTAPTGAGKSLFFQIPGIYLHENCKEDRLTLVICPLVALMVDQEKEIRDRGIEYATYINSSLTYEERLSRLDGIKTGKYSIIYLSPELLLAYDIRSLIGERKVGLMVVDEAHLVTSWGRDFRVDYWFLGDYIEKMRRGSYYSKESRMNFPVLCLTATAVYGGRDDVIGDLQNSLHLTCYPEHMYIGYVRRDNINFQINHPKKKRKSDKEEKLTLTTSAILKFIERKEKTIVYFPYTSQVEDVRKNIVANHNDIKEQVEKYYSSDMKSMEKDEAYSKFRDNESLVMMATKAFGMGVNIADIVNVYHYAPTGTLADYVQEVGRAARKLVSGYAITDYLSTDMHYARTLWGLSGLRHYQIKAMMKKLYELYLVNNSRNLLFSPETFNYLFDAKGIDAKVKSGLLLLSTDLLEKYHFKVVTVRPKNLFTKQYIVVPKSIEVAFMNDYSIYCSKMNDSETQIELAHGWHEQLTIDKVGDVYEIDLASLWETKFDMLTFPQFKHKFFSGGLFSYGEDKIIPNTKLVINYEHDFEYSYEKFMKLADALHRTFHDIKREFGGKNFKLNDFVQKITFHYEEKIRREYLLMLLDLFCYSHVDNFEVPTEPWKFIKKGAIDKNGFNTETVYAIRTQKNGSLINNLQRYIKQSMPNSGDGKRYITYLTTPREEVKQSYHQLVASILQLFDFASYELIGGRNPQIFVRINDPMKLRRISESGKEYKNNLLVEIEERHKRAVTIMNKFMGVERSNDERWEIIEEYFLGKDEVVDLKLGITTSEKVIVNAKKGKSIKQFSDTFNFDFVPGGKMLDFYNSWEEALEMPFAEALMLHDLPMATYITGIIKINNDQFDSNFTWLPQKVALMDKHLSEDQIRTATENGWNLLNSEEIDIQKLAEWLGA